jgi:hypothetical protein
MTKKLFLISFLLLPLICLSQSKELNIPIVNDAIYYQDTMSVKGQSKEQLYTKGKQWLVDNFVDYKAVIQTEDLHDGHLSAKGRTYLKTTTLGIGRKFADEFTIQMDFKDGKYRIKIYDFNVSPTDQWIGKWYSLTNLYNKVIGKKSAIFSKGQCKDLVLDNDAQVRKSIASLRNAMTTDTDF